MLKTSGYVVSTLSVVLLGIVSWQSASEKPLMLACLIGGMVASVAGMFLRWLSFEQRQKQSKGATAQLAPSSGAASAQDRSARPRPIPAAARRS